MSEIETIKIVRLTPTFGGRERAGTRCSGGGLYGAILKEIKVKLFTRNVGKAVKNRNSVVPQDSLRNLEHSLPRPVF